MFPAWNDQIMTRPSRVGLDLGLRTLRCRKPPALALAVAVAGMLPANIVTAGPSVQRAYAQTADSHIEYSENGSPPVGTFTYYRAARNYRVYLHTSVRSIPGLGAYLVQPKHQKLERRLNETATLTEATTIIR